MNAVVEFPVNREAPGPDDGLPHNVEAEQSVLGDILVSPGAIHAVSGFLEPKHFFEGIHQKIYATCLDLVASGRRADVVTLKDHLPYAMPIGEITLGHYIANLAAESCGSTEQYGRAVLDHAVRRSLIEISDTMRGLALASPADRPARSQIEEVVQRLSELSVLGLKRAQRQSTAYAAAEAILAEIENGTRAEPAVSTGFDDIDKIIGGYRRGNLIIVAGRPGMGKTTLAGASALRVAQRGDGVLFISKEMTKEQLVARLLADLAYQSTEPLSYQAILDRDIGDERHRFLVRAAVKRLRDLPLVIDPQPGMTIVEIAARSRRVSESMQRRGVRLGLVVIDHLGKIRPATKRGDNRNLELGDISSAAAELAKELDAPVVLLCQLNRQVETRTNRRPQLSDLRESGHIEEDADVVIGLYREAYYLSRDRESDAEKEVTRAEKLARCWADLDAIVLKNRHGGDGVAKLFVHMPSAAVRNKDRYS